MNLVEDDNRDSYVEIAKALNRIADAFTATYALQREAFQKQYPVRKEVVDATVTHRQTEEERLREAQGATDETDAEWVGRRTAKFEANQARKARKP
jgi:hypothetical protein